MNHQILGTVQKAKVLKKIAEGFVITVQDSEVTLPDEYAGDDIELDKGVEVFLYENKKGQAVATMNLPEATKDAYGWAEVVEVLPHMGVFVNIGLEDKDILVSSDNLPLLKSVWPKEGDNLFVSLESDKKGRLLAEPISEQEVIDDLEKAPQTLLHKVITARVYRSTKAGSAILTEEGYRGFIHPHERKKEPRLGETVEGRVIDVKEDGTINVSLRPLKQESMREDADVIFDYLLENDGVMELNDKSDPQEIRETFKISKSAFKRALGQLMKDGKIEQKEARTIIKHD